MQTDLIIKIVKFNFDNVTYLITLYLELFQIDGGKKSYGVN